ncbi:hypothetical protein [Sphingobium chlorophenolicum]|uniref:hypothetical protein n=1 Tax=Sphingobium chlorophenolicum TaxID=46429 RepID=UPI0012DF386D|nr:hypothetical protein [Sphingobium chlorophenolicum]
MALNGRVFGALFALAWFWIWAAHVATGLLDRLIAAAPSGRTSAIVRALDSFTRELLVQPLGRSLAAAVLVLAGVALAAFLYKTKAESA